MNHSQNSQKAARVARDELRERPICLFLLLRLSRDTKQEGAREIGFRDCLPAPVLSPAYALILRHFQDRFRHLYTQFPIFPTVPRMNEHTLQKIYSKNERQNS